MKLRNTDSFIVSSINDFKNIQDILIGKNLMVIVLGMLREHDTEQQWWSFFHPSYVVSDDWITIFVKNESHGFLSDLAESMAGKFLDGPAEILMHTNIEYPARLLHYIISNRQNKDKQTIVVGHSQGGIISVNALNACSKEDCKNIKAIFLGSANWTLPKYISKENCLCASNRYDYVCITCGRYIFRSTIKLRIHKLHAIKNYCYIVHNISKQLVNPDFKTFDRNTLKRC